MSEKLNRLKELLGEVSDLNKAMSVLSWDQQVNMPPGGSEGRGQQLATLGKIAQEKFTTDEIGKLLDDLKREFAGLVSAQLWEKINKDIRNLDDQIRHGNFSELLGWLREKIHTHGHKFDPQDLVKKVTGSKITPEPYVRYLTKKYGEIYGL